jgi:hypothetical protein
MHFCIHVSVSKLSNQAIIIVMLILPATAIVAIPLANTYFPPVFAQALLPESGGIGAFGFGPVPLGSPFDVSGLNTQAYGLAGNLPPISAPQLDLSQVPLSTFPPSESFAPGLTPASNGLEGLSPGAALPDLSSGFGLSSSGTGPLISPASPIPSTDPSSSTAVTIYACMDLISGNIPVNSLGSSSTNGCLFQTVPIVITVDGSTNTVSTCFIGPDMGTSTSNCISSTQPLQQQQQQQPGVTLTAPFQ